MLIFVLRPGPTYAGRSALLQTRFIFSIGDTQSEACLNVSRACNGWHKGNQKWRLTEFGAEGLLPCDLQARTTSKESDHMQAQEAMGSAPPLMLPPCSPAAEMIQGPESAGLQDDTAKCTKSLSALERFGRCTAATSCVVCVSMRDTHHHARPSCILP